MKCTWLLALAACGGPAGGGSGDSGQGGGGAGGTTRCGDREIAPGYPSVGTGCRTHASVQIGATKRELTGEHGIAPVGSALFGVAVADDAEAFVLTLPSIEPGDYNEDHCPTLDMPDLFSSHLGSIRVTVHANSEAVWGDIDARVGKVTGYIVIDGELTRTYSYISLDGRFAALRDEAVDCPGCTPVIDERNNLCTLPICTEQGCSEAFCYLQSDACANVAPPFDGTYGGAPVGFQTGGIHLTFSRDVLTAIRIDGLHNPDTGTPLVFEATEFPPGTVTQHGRDVHVAVDAQGPPPYETGNHIELDYRTGARLAVSGRIFWSADDAIDLTTPLARE